MRLFQHLEKKGHGRLGGDIKVGRGEQGEVPTACLSTQNRFGMSCKEH